MCEGIGGDVTTGGFEEDEEVGFGCFVLVGGAEVVSEVGETID
jgi:hypothetical protein